MVTAHLVRRLLVISDMDRLNMGHRIPSQKLVGLSVIGGAGEPAARAIASTASKATTLATTTTDQVASRSEGLLVRRGHFTWSLCLFLSLQRALSHGSIDDR